MHVQWDVSIASLVTWAVMVGSAIYTVARLTSELRLLVLSFNELKTDFKQHEEHDDKRFERINESLFHLVQQRKG